LRLRFRDQDLVSDGARDQEQPSVIHPPVRIVIAEEHPLFRSALRGVLSEQAHLEVVGEAADGEQAVELCRRFRPELVLMGLRMPRMDGLEATRAIKREFPSTAVLVVTAFEDPDHLSEAIKAGAAGYVLKSAHAGQIIEAVRKVLLGESPLNQEVAMRLLTRLLLKDVPKEDGEEALAEPLSPREVEVLRLMSRGQTNQQIAHNLLVSVSTVKKHVHNVLRKLGVSDRTQAIVKAVELGMGSERRQS
jgi:DNA-binding NarL/FixJ family response regulator